MKIVVSFSVSVGRRQISGFFQTCVSTAQKIPLYLASREFTYVPVRSVDYSAPRKAHKHDMPSSRCKRFLTSLGPLMSTTDSFLSVG